MTSGAEIVTATVIQSRGDALVVLIGAPIAAVVLLVINGLVRRAKHPDVARRRFIQFRSRENRHRSAEPRALSAARRTAIKTRLVGWAFFMLGLLLLVSTRTSHGLSHHWFVIVPAVVLFMVASGFALRFVVQAFRARQEE